jgi:hypothetical protein
MAFHAYVHALCVLAASFPPWQLITPLGRTGVQLNFHTPLTPAYAPGKLTAFIFIFFNKHYEFSISFGIGKWAGMR